MKEVDLDTLDKSSINYTLSLLLDREDVNHNDLFKAFKYIYNKNMLPKLNEVDIDDIRGHSLQVLLKE